MFSQVYPQLAQRLDFEAQERGALVVPNVEVLRAVKGGGHVKMLA